MSLVKISRTVLRKVRFKNPERYRKTLSALFLSESCGISVPNRDEPLILSAHLKKLVTPSISQIYANPRQDITGPPVDDQQVQRLRFAVARLFGQSTSSLLVLGKRARGRRQQQQRQQQCASDAPPAPGHRDGPHHESRASTPAAGATAASALPSPPPSAFASTAAASLAPGTSSAGASHAPR